MLKCINQQSAPPEVHLETDDAKKYYKAYKAEQLYKTEVIEY